MAWVIHNGDGQAVSIGTVLADPLPAGLTAVEISDADHDAMRDGLKRWDAATLALVDITLEPAPPTEIEAAAAILDEAQDLDPLLPADLADILARAAAALRGES